jgi:hypothetical protein
MSARAIERAAITAVSIVLNTCKEGRKKGAEGMPSGLKAEKKIAALRDAKEATVWSPEEL